MNNITCQQQRFLSMGYVEGKLIVVAGKHFFYSFLGFIYLFLSFISPADAATSTFSSAGTSTWTAPAGVSSATVEAWGGGGAGGGATGNPAKGGGGAGGQYAMKVVAVTPGSSYTVVVGTGGTASTGNGNSGGDSSFASTTVVAKGGAGGLVATTTNGTAGLGTTTGGVGTTVYAGGNGSDGLGATGVGGAGGGGAGSSGAGGNASGNTAGTGTTTSGGTGAAGQTSGGSCSNTAAVAGGGGCGGYATSATDRSGAAGAVGRVLITYAVTTTTLATGTDPAAAIIAPDAAATDVDIFTLQTNAGTEVISSVTVNLSTNVGIGLLTITDNTNTVLGSTSAPVTGSNTISVTGMTATTTVSSFKVRITPLSHVLMPVPPGASYAITAPVTAWVGTALHTGTDTDANSLTIDNTSPSAATSISGSAGALQNTLNWTTSVSSDFASSNGSVIYRWAAASAGSEVPTEGSTPIAGSTDGTATVACVISSSSATALSKIDGSGGSAGCTTTALTTGQSYTYKVFQKDANGNYNTGTTIGTFTPYGTVSASTSTVVANPTIVAADASAISTITVTLKDSAGTAVPNKTVSLATSSGSSIITTISGTSNASGVATFTVKDGTAEGPLTYTATDITDGIVITQTAQVSFISYTCFSDNFTSLNIADWNVIGSGTGYYTPNIVNGRLRMTSASNNLNVN